MGLSETPRAAGLAASAAGVVRRCPWHSRRCRAGWQDCARCAHCANVRGWPLRRVHCVGAARNHAAPRERITRRPRRGVVVILWILGGIVIIAATLLLLPVDFTK